MNKTLPELEKITVGELKKQFELFDDDFEVSFSGLTFYRLKKRGPKLVQIEFAQQVYRDSEGKVFVENVDQDDRYRS